tara:strand:+ start:644 stop:1348 length:705 start_codon:yes stop_codon:yes gene_type:complete
MLIQNLNCYKKYSNYIGETLYPDAPDSEFISKDQWTTYKIQNFDYKFNSWGFRGPEYKDYLGNKVNICLGDSYTVNIGGPIEHSWASQLSKKFDIPTLNLGVSGAGNDTIKLIYENACKIFDVQNTFVMYSHLHRRLENKKFIQVVEQDSTNIEYFKKQRLRNCFESVLPSHCLNQAEKSFFMKEKIYFKNWPPYSPEFNLKNETNRDGIHLNFNNNKIYTDQFYKQWKNKNES